MENDGDTAYDFTLVLHQVLGDCLHRNIIRTKPTRLKFQRFLRTTEELKINQAVGWLTIPTVAACLHTK